jgi:hypothetical protein
MGGDERAERGAAEEQSEAPLTETEVETSRRPPGETPSAAAPERPDAEDAEDAGRSPRAEPPGDGG